jgi:hypothetical protein
LWSEFTNSVSAGEGFHRVALRLHPDMTVALQYSTADVTRDCHDRGVRCAAFSKLRDRAMAQVVEPQAGQTRLLRQSPPRCSPAPNGLRRVKRSDVVANNLVLDNFPQIKGC